MLAQQRNGAIARFPCVNDSEYLLRGETRIVIAAVAAVLNVILVTAGDRLLCKCVHGNAKDIIPNIAAPLRTLNVEQDSQIAEIFALGQPALSKAALFEGRGKRRCNLVGGEKGWCGQGGLLVRLINRTAPLPGFLRYLRPEK